MSVPDLTISIVSYNTADYLRQCLDSIFKNTEGISFEVIVVDNASQDGSPAMVEKEFPQVRLIKNSENRLFSRAHNQAFAMAEGRYFLILNPDTVIPANTLKTCVQFLNARPQTGTVTCRELDQSGRLNENCSPFLTPAIEIVKRTWLRRFFKTMVRRHYMTGELNSIREVGTSTGCFTMVRADCLRQLGGFDEQLLLYYSDHDLGVRIWRAGYRIEFTPEVSYIHYGQQSTVGETRERIARIHSHDMYHYYRKHFGPVHASAMMLLLRVLRRLEIAAEFFTRQRRAHPLELTSGK